VIRQPPTDHAVDHPLHLIDCVKITQVMAGNELVDVPLEVLPADDVVHTHDTALEHRPEGVDPLRMNVTADVLARTMVDRLMAGQPEVGFVLIREETTTETEMADDEAVDAHTVRLLKDLSSNGPSTTALHADHGGLPATPRPLTRLFQ